MKKLFTLLMGCTFLSTSISAQTEPGLYTEWTKNLSEAPYLVAAASQKSMAIFNGELYIPNNGTQKIDIVTASTGVLRTTKTPSPALASAWALNGIAISNDGVVLTGSSLIGGTNLFLYKWDIEAGTYTALPAIPISGRSDFFTISGNFNQGEGLIATASNTGYITTAPVNNGVVGTPVTQVASTIVGVAASAEIIDETHIIYSAQNTQKTIYNTATNTGSIVKGTAINNNGANSAYFKFKGYEYVVSAENRFGALKIFDITDGATNATLVETTPDLGTGANASIATPICVDVKSDHIMIYVLAPNNGIAAYKFIPEKQVNEVVATPTFTPAEGTYTTSTAITIATTTENAVIRYTLDGTDPTETSTLYTGEFTISETTTVKAKAWLENYDPSETVTATYTIERETVATPTFSLPEGEYDSPLSITIASLTENAIIRYTLDGSDPTESSTVYTGELTLSTPQTVTIKVKAWLAEYIVSPTATITYTVKTATSIDSESVDGTSIRTEGNSIIVNTVDYGSSITVYTLQGKKVASIIAQKGDNTITLDKGVYVVTVNGKSTKVVL